MVMKTKPLDGLLDKFVFQTTQNLLNAFCQPCKKNGDVG